MIDDNCILVDWLTFASKSMGFDEMVCLIGLTGVNWQDGKGSRLHYQHTKTCGKITIHYTDSTCAKYCQGSCVEMSGSGCRFFESCSDIDFGQLFQFLYSESFNDVSGKPDITVSRLDFAYDDHTGVLDIDLIAEFARRFLFRSPKQKLEIFESYEKKDPQYKCITVTHGARSSDIYIRIYDKRVERQAFDLDHWIRFELQLRKDAACGFIRQFGRELLAGERFPIGKFFSGIVANSLTYICPYDGENISRAPVAPWWSRFLGDAEKISCIARKDMEYNLESMERYAIQQNHNHTKTLIEMVGMGEYLLSLHDKCDPIPTKYKTVAAALQNGDAILAKLETLDIETGEKYLTRCRDSIDQTLARMEEERRKLNGAR